MLASLVKWVQEVNNKNMGHKVHPKIYRTPLLYAWDSKWFAKKGNSALCLEQDILIRQYLEKKLREAGIDAIGVERSPKDVIVNILAAKPGAVIGRNGQGLEELRKYIEKKILSFKLKVRINVQAVKQPALSARVVALSAASDVERRMAFRRVMKQTVDRVMQAGAKGVKISMAGRLNGAEIARRETISDGKMSLITLRSDVDYSLVEADTIYGKIGIKVWIYKGESFAFTDKFDKKEENK